MKTKLFNMSLAAAVVILVMTGCNGNNPSGGGLIGTWKVSFMSTFVGYERYQKDHTMIHIEVYDDGDVIKDLYTWEVDGDVLTTKDERGRTESCTYTVNGNTMVRTQGISITYTRCPDSEMDYYLEQLADEEDEPTPVNPPEPANPDEPTDPEEPTPDPNEPSSDCSNIQASYLATGGSGFGDIKEQLVTGAKSWFYDAQYGARVSKSNTEAWLYTPEYDMSGMASVQVAFQHAINYAGDMQTQQTMWVTDNFTGDVATTNWQQLTIPNYPAGNNWTFVSNTVNVPIQYVGEKTVIAFKYTSGGNGNTATWEIKNLTINAVCANN